jgi:hypothetical protein
MVGKRIVFHVFLITAEIITAEIITAEIITAEPGRVGPVEMAQTLFEQFLSGAARPGSVMRHAPALTGN